MRKTTYKTIRTSKIFIKKLDQRKIQTVQNVIIKICIDLKILERKLVCRQAKNR